MLYESLSDSWNHENGTSTNVQNTMKLLPQTWKISRTLTAFFFLWNGLFSQIHCFSIFVLFLFEMQSYGENKHKKQKREREGGAERERIQLFSFCVSSHEWVSVYVCSLPPIPNKSVFLIHSNTALRSYVKVLMEKNTQLLKHSS